MQGHLSATCRACLLVSEPLPDTKKWRMVTAQGSARQLRPLTPSQTLSTKSQDHRDGAGWDHATNTGIRHTEPQGVDLEAPPARSDLGTKIHRATMPPFSSGPTTNEMKGNGWANTCHLMTRDTLCWFQDYGANGTKVKESRGD